MSHIQNNFFNSRDLARTAHEILATILGCQGNLSQQQSILQYKAPTRKGIAVATKKRVEGRESRSKEGGEGNGPSIGEERKQQQDLMIFKNWVNKTAGKNRNHCKWMRGRKPGGGSGTGFRARKEKAGPFLSLANPYGSPFCNALMVGF